MNVATKIGFFQQISNDLYAAYLAFKNPETPVVSKVLMVASLLYVIFPFDFLPDLIPVLGWLDDIGIATVLIKASTATVPAHIMQPAQEEANVQNKKVLRWVFIAMGVLFTLTVVLGVSLIAALLKFIFG